MAAGKRGVMRLGVVSVAIAALFSGTAFAHAGTRAGSGLPASSSADKGQGVVYGRLVTGHTAIFHLIPASFGPYPANMPDTAVTVQLPLFPRAFPSFRPFPLAYQTTPQTPYAVTGGSNYILKTSRAVAEKWYGRHFAAAGYQLTGEATVGDFKTGQSSDGFTYTSRKHPGVAVDLSFQTVGSHRTLLRYWVKDVLVPARSPAFLLPSNTVSIEVQYSAAGGKTPVIVEIVNPQVIRSWVQQINALPVDTRSIQCSTGKTENAVVSFMNPSGQTVAVKVDPTCGEVILPEYPPLLDKGIWKLVLQAVHKSS